MEDDFDVLQEKVLYFNKNRDKIDYVIENILCDAINSFNSRISDDEVNIIAQEAFEKVLYLSQYVKKDDFAYEEEYRFIIKKKGKYPNYVKNTISIKDGHIRNHLDVPLDLKNIKKIIISQNIDYELARDGIRTFYEEKGVSIPSIKQSTVIPTKGEWIR